METQNIIHKLQKYKQVADMLSAKKWVHFKWYFFIKESYLKKNFDETLKKRFCWFYAFRGMSASEKDMFFRYLFSEKDANLRTILQTISQQRNKVFFSFVTKLLHTRDNALPIYDNLVAQILELPRPTGTTVGEKIQNRERIYETLRVHFQELLSNQRIQLCLENIIEELLKRARQENFQWRDELVTNEKLLDSALWILHKIKHSGTA